LNEISFTVDGEVIPKGRPRMTRSGRVYTPKRTKDYELKVKLAAKRAFGDRSVIKGPVFVELIIFRKIPEAKVGKGMEGTFCDIGSDIDNQIKGIFDGVNGSGVWVDDRQVAMVTAEKRWGAEARLVAVIGWD
jgi:Holliday junction resolvase RusA-like endonuclease